MTISQRIFYLLKEQGKKQSELSDYAGISTSTISAWNKRGTDPPANLISTIADFLGVSSEYLLTGKEKSPQSIESEQTTNNQIKCINTREKEMMYLFRRLSEQNQDRIIGRLEYMVEQAQTEESAV
ncbi:MAG: helix-turn-helix domain-containing protein [Ruminococcus sp.]|nr:helix-turn-helix domain-containing protein [Ruminococcus sp.]